MENNTVMSVPSHQEVDIVVSDKSVEAVIAQAEKRVEILKKVLGVAVKRTNPKDWTDMQGHPYLTASGAEKIAPLFGLKMEGVVHQRMEREDEKGKYYIYQAQARFWWAAGDMEAIGVCSSRDKFFSWDSAKKEWKPLHETDEGNIMKAAFSNLLVNGITRSLGLRNLTWADLEPFGIKQSDTAKVEYNKGASADPAQAGIISEAQGKRLYAISKASGYDDKSMHEALMFNFNIASTKHIPWKKYEDICKWFEANKVVVK